MYDTSQPRISMTPEDPDKAIEHGTRELGQAAAMGEAMFFLTLGYVIHIARWDGNRFVVEENYLPADA